MNQPPINLERHGWKHGLCQNAICTRESVLIQDLTRDKAHSTSTKVPKILAGYLWKILLHTCVLCLCTHVIVLCTRKIVLHLYAYKPSTNGLKYQDHSSSMNGTALQEIYRSGIDSFRESVRRDVPISTGVHQ